MKYNYDNIGLDYIHTFWVEHSGQETRSYSVKEEHKQISINKLFVALPYANNPINDLCNVTLGLRIADKYLLENITLSAFDLNLRDISKEVIVSIINNLNIMMVYEFKPSTNILVLNEEPIICEF